MLMILPIDYLGYIIKFLSRKLTIINGRSFPKDCLGEVRKPSGDAVTCEFLAYKKNLRNSPLNESEKRRYQTDFY